MTSTLHEGAEVHPGTVGGLKSIPGPYDEESRYMLVLVSTNSSIEVSIYKVLVGELSIYVDFLYNKYFRICKIVAV